MFDIQIFGTKFIKPNQFGDFNWMCHQNNYSNTLFIFNDNEEYHKTCKTGAGNAIMRRYNKYSKIIKPKSAGIPTGTLKNGGYTKLSTKIKFQIDNAFNEIISLINIHKYDQLYYSSELDGKIGTSLFVVNDIVLRYITHKIYNLSINPICIKIIKIQPNDLYDDEFNIEDDDDNDDNDNSDDDLI